jgi:ClpP class serine protease
MTIINLTHLLSDALTTEWMMTLEACVALKRIYLDALGLKGQVGSLKASDIESLWAQHDEEGLGLAMHMLREEESSMAAQTEPMKGTNYTSVYKNVAIIDVIGPIVPRVRGMSSGSVGAQQIKNDFITAFESENIKGILFNVDSPGGDARGISELAQTIQRARDKNTKPIHAYAAGWMASAAYFISAASHRIVANDWASVGSIGVVIGVPPKTPEDDIEFVSTQSPNKRPDATTDEGKGVYQQKADYMGELFVKAVASLRGVTEEKVLQDFGRGGTLIGKQAVAAGLADALGTFDSALHALITSKPLSGARAGASLSGGGEETMSTKKSIWARFIASLGNDERKEALDALRESGDAGDEGEAGAGSGGNKPAKVEESAEVKALRARAARYEADALSRRTESASTYAKSLVTYLRLMPAGLESATKVYAALSEADENSPVAEGEKSRVDEFKAMCATLPQHMLCREMVASDLPQGAVALNPNGGSQDELVKQSAASARAYGEKLNTAGLHEVKK